MIFNIILAAMLIVAFFMCINSYILGLKHGKQLVNKEIPINFKDPLTWCKEVKKEHELTKLEKELAKEEKKYTEGIERMMSYTGEVENED